MFLDSIIILLFAGALILGFFQGVVRLAVLLVTCYLSLVLASLYFASLGSLFEDWFDTTRDVGSYSAFALILLVSYALLAAAGLSIFRNVRLPGNLLYLDRVLGTLLGLLLAGLFIGTFAVLLWNLMVERGGSEIDLPVMQWLGRSVQKSFLLRFFGRTILPGSYALVDPFLPDAVKMIFVAQDVGV